MTIDSPGSPVPKISVSLCLRTVLWGKNKEESYCEILDTAAEYQRH